MNDILHEHIAVGYCVCYCDDLLICTASDDPDEHLLKLTTLLDTVQQHDLLIKGSKSKLFRSQVEFPGFNVSEEWWSPTESKVSAVVLASA